VENPVHLAVRIGSFTEEAESKPPRCGEERTLDENRVGRFSLGLRSSFHCLVLAPHPWLARTVPVVP
jgi:hypothetical protein